MAIFKNLWAFARAGKRLSNLLVIIFMLGALPAGFSITPALAYDNSVLPPFEVDPQGRGINAVSIHPDGERWLISECTDRIEPPRMNCYLFLYNRTSKSYQRYDLPAGFRYTDAQFSPTGQWIVGVRTKIPKINSSEEQVRAYLESEIFLLRPDGAGFRTLSTPNGRVKYPAISPDESKIAYWLSGRVRRPGAKTMFMDFDIYEIDLASQKNVLFSGPYKFFLAQGLKYKNNNAIIANAYAPTAFTTSMGTYRAKFGSSEIYLFRRGISEFPEPEFSSIPSATSPTFSSNKRAFVLGSPRPHGMSIVEASDKSEIRHWRIPRLAEQGIASIAASPTGTYIVFIYSITPLSSAEPKNNLGIFDLLEERWIPVSLPTFDSARLLRIQN